MLQFLKDNIFVKNTAGAVKASATYFIPFQFKVANEGTPVNPTIFKLVNGSREIDMSLANINVYYDDDYYYFIFKHDNDVSNILETGFWQIRITLSSSEIYYSNWIEVVCHTQIQGYFDFYNSKDFSDIIFQTGFLYRLYVTSQFISTEQFKKETFFEKSDGTKIYEFQSVASGYSFSMLTDIWQIQQIEFMSIYDNFSVTFNEFEDENLFEKPTIEKTFENYQYKLNINFFINNTTKSQCLKNKEIVTVPWILGNGIWNSIGIWTASGIWNSI